MTDTTSDVLRRMVLTSPDGYQESVAALLRSLGYGVGWVRVSGNSITVYLGGQEPDRPSVADGLLRDFGGQVSVGSSPVDRGWYQWTWQAPL